MERSVYQEHNGRDPIPNYSEEHYTQPDPIEDHIYSELNTIQPERPRGATQYASISDHQYTELNTMNKQGKKPMYVPQPTTLIPS